MTTRPSRDEILETRTYKTGNSTTGKRVFYSLCAENDNDATKAMTLKFLGLLAEKLEEKGLLTGKEIDDILLESVL